MDREERVFTELDIVKIPRSDGRIHDAQIIAIIQDRKVFSVQWFENGEAKGKEIDFDLIFAINRPKTGNRTTTAANTTTVATYVTSATANTCSAAVVTERNTVNKERRRTTRVGGTWKWSAETDGAVAGPSVQATVVDNGGATGVVAKYRSRTSEPNPSLDESRRLTMHEPRRRGTRANAGMQVGLATHEEEARPPPSRGKIEKGNPNWEFLMMIQDFVKNLPYHPISLSDSAVARRICVAIRKRPLNRKEILQKEIDVISIPSKDRVIIHEPKLKVDLKKYLENQEFRFDFVFDESADTELVYHFTARPLVHSIFEGGNASCFAYGQTGSGKTHTMGGDFTRDKKQNCENGIYILAAREIFELLKKKKYAGENFKVTASFFEIYSGRVIDLMTKSQLRVLVDAKAQVQIVGLREIDVQNVRDILNIIQDGSAARSSGVTAANANSSRSHAIFQINLKRNNKVHGKLYIIDLAGNERGADTMSACRQTRMEGAEINRSLLALKECIRALGFKSSHLPFRDSKLTQVLKDSFVGENSRTCMIATVSPGMQSCEHTMNTLRYANRVKELEVEGVQNGTISEIPSTESNKHMGDDEEMEVSANYYSFHEVLKKIHEVEDDVLQYHRQYLSLNSNWSQVLQGALNNASIPDYDIDGYIQNVRIVVRENLEATKEFLEKLECLSEHLREEETLSKGLKKSNK